MIEEIGLSLYLLVSMVMTCSKTRSAHPSENSGDRKTAFSIVGSAVLMRSSAETKVLMNPCIAVWSRDERCVATKCWSDLLSHETVPESWLTGWIRCTCRGCCPCVTSQIVVMNEREGYLNLGRHLIDADCNIYSHADHWDHS